MSETGCGNLFIVAAPSGGGKTSLVKQLVCSLPGVEVSISHTTRPIRPGELDGVDYFFVTEQAFSEAIEAKAFIEYAQVFNHMYGTSVAQISDRLRQGIDIVLDIDWQGAQQIKTLFPEAVSIFIVPPSMEVLQERLQNRGQDKGEVILDRMRKAQSELAHYTEFDYLIINDTFNKAAAELIAIVTATRLLLPKQANKHAKLLSILLSAQ